MACSKKIMIFPDELWSVCDKKSFEGFSIRLIDRHSFNLHFSPAWPAQDIKHALTLNLCSDAAMHGAWNIYCITTNEFDITPILNSYNRDQHGKLDMNGDTEIVAFYDSLNHIFRIYDLTKKYAAIIYPSNPSFNEWDIHSPLREFFHIWALRNNALLIHSGIVSEDGVAVLMPGAGGSGKSTTVISCLQENMTTTGDDYNLVYNDDGVFRVCPIYNNLKLKTAKANRPSFSFPVTQNWESKNLSYAEKIIYYPQANSHIWDRSGPKISGILCPDIAKSSACEPAIIPVKYTGLINRLAVSSIMQSPFMAKEYLAMSMLLAKQSRIAGISLSTDTKANAECIRSWLRS